jgi:hypothetical protein
VALMLRLSGVNKDEPVLISKLVQIAMFGEATRWPLAEGLAAHVWSDREIADLQKEFDKVDFLTEYGDAMRGERAMVNGNLAYILRNRRQAADMFGSDSPPPDGPPSDSLFYKILPYMPAGWFRQNQLFISRIFQEVYLPPVDAANHRVHAAESAKWKETLDERLRAGFPPEVLLGWTFLPALGNAEFKFGLAQVQLDEARVACALERYRLAHGNYPETLAALEPQFIQNAPVDIFSGQPLKYRRADDGKFILYSVGWNEKDDGGKVVMYQGGKPQDFEKGDWVWPMN